MKLLDLKYNPNEKYYYEKTHGVDTSHIEKYRVGVIDCRDEFEEHAIIDVRFDGTCDVNFTHNRISIDGNYDIVSFTSMLEYFLLIALEKEMEDK